VASVRPPGRADRRLTGGMAGTAGEGAGFFAMPLIGIAVIYNHAGASARTPAWPFVSPMSAEPGSAAAGATPMIQRLAGWRSHYTTGAMALCRIVPHASSTRPTLVPVPAGGWEGIAPGARSCRADEQ
jgi:hypothetical protein